MKTRAIVGLALTGVAILVSCTQDQPSSSLSPTDPSFASGKPPATVNYCSFSTISTTARDYFADRGDEVYGLIATMSTAYKAGGADGATSAGFDVLARLGVATDAGGSALKSTATPLKGSAFANAVLKCMSVTGFVPADGEVVSFSAALGANGLFAVRSKTESTPVYSRGLDAFDAPLFGAQPTLNTAADPDNSFWPIKTSTTGADAVSLSGKALFYGWKSLESNTTLSGEDLSSVGFQLHTLPTPLTFTPKIRVGVCSVDNVNARTIHVHNSVPSILAPGGELSFCPASLGYVAPKGGAFAMATRQLVSWFAPKPLFAAPYTRGGGGAGLVDGLSEFGAVEFTGSITWVAEPIDRTSLSAPTQFPPIKLTVTTLKDDGTPNVPYVGPVTLQVVGNNGNFLIDGNVKDTDANGAVTFSALTINKAGGYTMTAVTGIGNSTTVTFWINGQ